MRKPFTADELEVVGQLPEYASEDVHSDWFDMDWVYVAKAGGATVKPGCPKIPDITEWEKYVTVPDLDKTRGSNLTIGIADSGIRPGFTPEQIADTARKWFDRYKDERVAMAFLMPNPIFSQTVYQCSREYHTED